MKNINEIKKVNFPCPCGGKILWKRERIVEEDIDCGILDTEHCNKCGERYFPDWSMKIVENKLREAGLWGVERKEIRFWKSGNSVVTRFPVELVNELKLSNIKKAHIYKRGDHKLTIEF